MNKKKKKTTTRSRSVSRSVQIPIEICDYKHEIVDTKIEHSNIQIEKTEAEIEKIKENIEKLKESIEKAKAEHTPLEENIKNQIVFTREIIYGKIDKINDTLKGDTELGLIQQVKKLNNWLIVILSCVILMIGGEVGGIGLQDIKTFLSKKITSVNTGTVENSTDEHIKKVHKIENTNDSNEINNNFTYP